MNTPHIDGFSDENVEAFAAFCAKGTTELSRDVDAFAVETVLERLLSQTSQDIRAVFSFHPTTLEAATDPVTQKECGTLNMPLYATDVEYMQIADKLDLHPTLKGERWGLRETGRFGHILQFDALLSYIHKRFRHVGTRCMNAFYVMMMKDRMFPSQKKFQELNDSDDERHDSYAQKLIKRFAPPNDQYEEKHLEGLSSLTGFTFPQRLKAKFKNNLPKAVDACIRLLISDEQKQRQMLLNFQSLRLIPQAYAAESIVRQGYRTFAQMDAMTEYDMWERIMDEKEVQTLAILNAGPRTLAEAVAEIQRMAEFLKKALEQTPKDNVLTTQRLTRNVAFFDRRLQKYTALTDGVVPPGILNEEDYALWQKASNYVQTHKPEERRPLREVIGCDTYRADIARLREACQWQALGAKEREVVQRVFSEAMVFGYENTAPGGQSIAHESYQIGTPTYAFERRRLNCFSGPWLIATLCLEAGLTYDQLLFCNVNEASGKNGDRYGSHGALLIRYSDQRMAQVDFGHHRCNQPFPMAAITEQSQNKALTELLEHSRTGVNYKQKIVNPPIHITIKDTLADVLGITRDMTVTTLDQGFAGLSLLNVGIDLEMKGKRAEAKAAYELGLVSFPTQPDLLCRLGIIVFQEGDLARADQLFTLALDSYGGHLLSIYYKGLLAWHQGDEEQALEYFEGVVKDPRDIWGDDSFKKKAKEYAKKLSLTKLRSEEKKPIESSNERGLDSYAELVPIDNL